ncbi:MAG: dihydroorotate dehydrogenase-like protein [Planctomycetota bacterium]
MDMNLSTNYLGLRLKNPLIAGASPLSRSVDHIRSLEDAGVAAIVLYSLFQEEIEGTLHAHQHYSELGTHSYAEALTYLPQVDLRPNRPQEYARHVARAKEIVGIPIVASLNGSTLGGWTLYAQMLEQAGADALELNVYHMATSPNETAADVERRYVDILQAVKATVHIPVALKIGPFFSSLPHFVTQLDEKGVDGFVLFNRFYQPDVDLEALDVVPELTLSSPHEMRLPLRWIAVLDPLIEASLAAATGVYTAADVLKLLMVGADAVMLVAVLLRNGFGAVGQILHDVQRWMYEHDYESVHQMQGSMNHRGCGDPSAFERMNYMKSLDLFTPSSAPTAVSSDR